MQTQRFRCLRRQPKLKVLRRHLSDIDQDFAAKQKPGCFKSIVGDTLHELFGNLFL